MLKHIIKAESYSNKTAIIFNELEYSYSKLLSVSRYVSANLLGEQSDLSEDRVAFMVNPGFDYVATQWGIWQAGGVAVPLCITHPLNALEYVINDTGAKIIIVDACYLELLQELAKELDIRIFTTSSLQIPLLSNLPELDNSRMAMILYTSGTTNLPKGVVSTFANLEAQVDTLLQAWEWQDSDHTLCLLPLHHVHGIVNVVCCSLAAGAVCQFLDKFSPEAIFKIFKQRDVNVFMAVPTIYFKLIAFWDTLDLPEKESIRECLEGFRLMISGSAALPITVMDRWKIISGHTLLERYGMTEIGMAISNSYRGERLAGYVGKALPGVEVRLASEDDHVVIGEPGEIQIKGANVFPYYWQRPEETAKSFTEDGWFKTGDIAILENNNYKILGRNSTDIIKSGGYKISALEIEEVLRTHPEISDCAVVGIEDEEWGELVGAAIVAKSDTNTQEINTWIRDRMASYKTPKRYIIVSELPRNTMGKVTKKDVKILF
ncbi:acyl-CoA synthetase [Daejeonella sp.]|jgi:malonyl-CoA/methylmalonyl-CoA synthetase|uniref:acyl-CoA synthetase n=1 Tax=Daejeonella sp. TaxID=2805397 RepID=UPI0037C13BA2